MKLSDLWTEDTETETHPNEAQWERERRQAGEIIATFSYCMIAVTVGVLLAAWWVTR